MASIFVQIDKEFYFAGDTVSGNVCMVLNQNMNAHDIVIKFKGWQTIKWIEKKPVPKAQLQAINKQTIPKGLNLKMESSDSESGEQEDFYREPKVVNDDGNIVKVYKYSGCKTIAKFKTCLYNFGGDCIPQGQYRFPFSFKTAENYPASFLDKDKNKMRKGRIKYEMQAFVKGLAHKSRLIKHKTEIIIRQTAQIKNEKKSMITNVKSCCCINQGISRIQCFFEKNAYSPGQNANIFCLIDNRQSKIDIKSVRVQLMNILTYTSKQNVSKIMERVLFQRILQGVPKKEEAQRQEIVKLLEDQKFNKEQIVSTTKGKYIKSAYQLKVQAILGVHCICCNKLPIVYQPIQLYPYIQSGQKFQPPYNWNPKQMPISHLQMSISTQNFRLQHMKQPSF